MIHYRTLKRIIQCATCDQKNLQRWLQTIIPPGEVQLSVQQFLHSSAVLHAPHVLQSEQGKGVGVGGGGGPDAQGVPMPPPVPAVPVAGEQGTVSVATMPLVDDIQIRVFLSGLSIHNPSSGAGVFQKLTFGTVARNSYTVPSATAACTGWPVR